MNRDFLKIEALLANIVQNVNKVLQDNLVGIYLHGSLAMGCFNPNSSDVDFLIIIHDEIDITKKREIIHILLEAANQVPDNGLEMSVLLKQAVIDFKYPTPFVLHYSNQHKAQYLRDPEYLCADDEDPDLAAHLEVIRNRGICLYGESIRSVFKKIPKKYYLASLLWDLEGVEQNIIRAPVYSILNLCRVLQYLRQGVISSKAEGGDWALQELPSDYREPVNKALSIYKHNELKQGYLEEELTEFAEYMMRKIRTEIAKDNGMK